MLVFNPNMYIIQKDKNKIAHSLIYLEFEIDIHLHAQNEKEKKRKVTFFEHLDYYEKWKNIKV